jgi:hypothetical protein
MNPAMKLAILILFSSTALAYNFYKDTIFPGAEIKPYFGPLTKCPKACDYLKNCAGYYTIPGGCMFVKRWTYPLPAIGQDSYMKPVQRPASRNYRQLKSTTFKNYVFIKQYIGDYLDCPLECDRTPNCIGYFQYAQRICWLMKNLTNPTPLVGIDYFVLDSVADSCMGIANSTNTITTTIPPVYNTSVATSTPIYVTNTVLNPNDYIIPTTSTALTTPTSTGDIKPSGKCTRIKTVTASA